VGASLPISLTGDGPNRFVRAFARSSRPRATVRRMERTRALMSWTTCALACAALVAAIVPAAATASTRYATVHALCAAPRADDASCLALALRPARAGAAGARAYATAAGATSTGPAGGLTPGDLASAYKYSPDATVSGQTLAIVDAFDDPNVEADLATFDANYSLSACTSSNGCFEKVGETGSTSSLPEADKVGWSAEIALDVETAHSVCESCKILLVEASSEALSDLAAAVNEAAALGASEISNSYGALETQMGASEQSAYDHPGTVVVAASGDAGYLNWDFVAAGMAAPEMPLAPASLPTVVSVGGTALKLTSAGARASESVWNDSGPPSGTKFKQFAAGGGGCSTLFAAPSWQLGAAGWSSTGCGSMRLDNDVAAVADPYTGFDIYDSYAYSKEFKTGWLTIGGTSLTAPLIAGMYALAGGAHGTSYPASTPYAHAGQSTALYDVAKGGNGYCDGEAPGMCGEPEVNELLGKVDCEGTSACDAIAGFDGPSGVGSPTGLVALGGPAASKPLATTLAATSVTASSAVLNGSVNPNGATVTACKFEYGTTTALGGSAPCSPPPGSGMSAVPVSAPIGGLAPGTTYYFRVVATNVYGTRKAAKKTFKTL
jgi:subtilase family serine protease